MEEAALAAFFNALKKGLPLSFLFNDHPLMTFSRAKK